MHQAGARRPLPRWLLPAAGAAAFLGCIAGAASIGGPQGPVSGLAVVLELLIRAGWPAAVYLLAAVGLGELFAPILRTSASSGALRASLGLGLMLSLSHGLGCLGLLGGRAGTAIAAAVCLLGLALLGRRLAGLKPKAERWFLAAAPAVAGAAVMLVAACNPPGWLWDSEAGGYDALEYHLQLPQEWIRLGRIGPLQHNVYSFLPGYVESAFVHLAAMTGAPGAPAPGIVGWGLLAGDGWRAISCQLLSSGIAVFAAVQIAALVLAIGRRRGAAGAAWNAGALAAATLVLCTPWTIVVGSLAYNDLAVVAFLAAAMTAAVDTDLRPAIKGAIVGLLIGLACGCKPTALFLAGAPAGLALLACTPRKQWGSAVAAGAAAGLVAIAPWLVRNGLASGNPVFPFVSSIFGTAHWTAEQVERYQHAHAFHGTIVQRLGLLALADPSDPAGPRPRGLTHPQWFAFFAIVFMGAAAVAAWRPARRLVGVLLLAFAVQIAAWLFLTHVQSRFLVPAVVPGAAIFGIAAGLLAGDRGRIKGGALLAPFVCTVQLLASVVIFAEQRRGEPNGLLLAGPALRTGESIAPEERPRILPQAAPELLINLTTPASGVVYLLGDATPFYYTVDVLYNTTFDRWPFGEAIRAAPDKPEAWTDALRRRGVSLVLVNFNELGRLSRSGWADPVVTPAAIEAWLKSGPRVVRNWPEQGWLLVELPEASR